MLPSHPARLAATMGNTVLLGWEKCVSNRAPISHEIFRIMFGYVVQQTGQGLKVTKMELEKALTGRFGCSSPTARNYIRDAISGAYLILVADTDDRRRKHVEITEKLNECLENQWAVSKPELERLLELDRPSEATKAVGKSPARANGAGNYSVVEAPRD